MTRRRRREMHFRMLTLGLVALAVLLLAGVVGATSTMSCGHSAASARRDSGRGPLDPLTADRDPADVHDDQAREEPHRATFLPLVKLSEPPKSFMQGWSPSQAFPEGVRQRLRPQREHVVGPSSTSTPTRSTPGHEGGCSAYRLLRGVCRPMPWCARTRPEEGDEGPRALIKGRVR
jgi:hypothetical protein